MVFGFHYCENCKNEIEDLDVGYGEYSGQCKRWQCRLINYLYIIVLCCSSLFITIFDPIAGAISFVVEKIKGEKNGIRN